MLEPASPSSPAPRASASGQGRGRIRAQKLPATCTSAPPRTGAAASRASGAARRWSAVGSKDRWRWRSRPRRPPAPGRTARSSAGPGRAIAARPTSSGSTPPAARTWSRRRPGPAGPARRSSPPVPARRGPPSSTQSRARSRGASGSSGRPAGQPGLELTALARSRERGEPVTGSSGLARLARPARGSPSPRSRGRSGAGHSSGAVTITTWWPGSTGSGHAQAGVAQRNAVALDLDRAQRVRRPREICSRGSSASSRATRSSACSRRRIAGRHLIGGLAPVLPGGGRTAHLLLAVGEVGQGARPRSPGADSPRACHRPVATAPPSSGGGPPGTAPRQRPDRGVCATATEMGTLPPKRKVQTAIGMRIDRFCRLIIFAETKNAHTVPVQETELKQRPANLGVPADGCWVYFGLRGHVRDPWATGCRAGHERPTTALLKPKYSPDPEQMTMSPNLGPSVEHSTDVDCCARELARKHQIAEGVFIVKLAIANPASFTARP